MKISINQPWGTVPGAFVTKGRQRVKQYGSTVYLKNGEEFEIELFNPTQTKVLAKIKINGDYISSSGVVLRPGERMFLERYLNEARKFLFETYHVDGDDPNAREAIRRNGDVEVEFYEQYIPKRYTTITEDWTWQPSTYTGSSILTYSGTDVKYMKTSGPKGLTEESGVLDANNSVSCCNTGNTLNEQSLETGRVEEGGHSHQEFGFDCSSYNIHYSWKSEWKLLPRSQKPIMREDLVAYCTSCGSRRRKESHKFCPHCGSKF